MFISQGLQVIVVALAIAVFFVAFGALSIPPSVRDGWIGSHANVIVGFRALGEHIELSRSCCAWPARSPPSAASTTRSRC